ncbi:hypothetical protein PASE110613_07365 [Paenibacillus sediminis]|uniref:DUF3951 domain-containing protein n=1 Tax=Paenibacillus sediminis TaxID=664909 RepID=A0ABS4H2U4_9BACL|nr:hypothetical protein [Paenibacillus sediminis]MBP1936843.1 hypothetical protein [Paenibacillus sediminis]
MISILSLIISGFLLYLLLKPVGQEPEHFLKNQPQVFISNADTLTDDSDIKDVQSTAKPDE